METELVSKNSTIDQQARLLEEQGRAIKAFMQAESATEFITATERIAQEKEEAGHELEFLREKIGAMPSTGGQFQAGCMAPDAHSSANL